MGAIDLGSELRTIPGRVGYFVDVDGRVYSARLGGMRALAVGRDRDGYPTVQLAKPGRPGRSDHCAIHRLVAAVFLPPRPSARHEIRHLDGDKSNSRPTNLQWGTAKDNADDRERHGRTARGEHAGRAKLTAEDVAGIRVGLAAGRTHHDLAEEHGVTEGAIGHVKSGMNWGGRPMNIRHQLEHMQVRRIRRRLAEGASDQAVASELNVSRYCIKDIRLGRTWKSVR